MVFSYDSSRMASQLDSQISKNVELSAVVAHQSNQIKKLEVDFNMLYELVLALARSSHFLVSLSKISIGSVRAAVKDVQ